MDNLKIYCVTNKFAKALSKTEYEIGWVGHEKPPNHYITCDNGDNIFYKEKYYSELTFQYWYWKNQLNVNNDEDWIGFCQKRRFWVNENFSQEIVNESNFKESILNTAPKKWENYDAIICKKIDVSNVKKMKIFKRGFKSILEEPGILFNKSKCTIKLHFDMFHGHGNLKKAANLLGEEDRKDFLDYINTRTSFHPHIMFIAKKNTTKDWFDTLFPWLERCEKVFGFDTLRGYDTQRLYAFLAERYLSFWFEKYTKSLEWPWIFYEEN
tara:strand:+ start:154 stop:957 length:804 start_codon:yes stop_codon:yes gene_type:complete